MRVSVVIPVYNAGGTLAGAIESALGQHFEQDFEIIAVNDGSTDSTAAVLERYSERVRIVNQGNQGLSGARNAGVAAASGEYLAFLDADDLWMPEKLAASLTAFAAKPQAILVYTDAAAIDLTGAKVAPSFVPPAMARTPTMDDLLTRWWPILPSTVVIRRASFIELGGFCAEMRSYEDMDFYLRARELGEFEYLARPLTAYRRGSDADRMVKYEQSHGLFVHRVSQRYGRVVRPLIREIRHSHATARGFLGLLAMRDGKMKLARRHFMRALYFEPFGLKSLLRLARTILPVRLARILSGRSRIQPTAPDPEFPDQAASLR